MTPNPQNSKNSITGTDGNNGNGFSSGGFVTAILQTRECRQAIDALVADLAAQWSGESAARKSVVNPFRRFIGRRLSRPGDRLMEKELVRLFEKPEFVEVAGAQIPALINSALDILHSITHSLEQFPQDKKSELVGNLFSEVDAGKMARIFTSLTRTADTLRAGNPIYFSEKILPQIQAWLVNADFGELRERFDNSKEDYNSLIIKLCELAFEYPAKFIILLSFIPGIANYFITFLADMTERFTALSPDMLADILLSFFREMDGHTVGKLLNNLTEIVRQIHTGSALIGESGAPKFTSDLSEKTREVLGKTDPELFIKARNALIDGRETLVKTFTDIAAENPEFLVQELNHFSLLRNSRTRILKRKIELIEDLPEEESIEALEKGLTAWTTYDLADIVNSVSRMANRVHELKPDVLGSLMTEFTGSLDLYEIEESVRWLANDMGKAARPLARTVVPVLVKEFCGFFTPEDDGQDEAIQEAREMLRGFILNGEAK